VVKVLLPVSTLNISKNCLTSPPHLPPQSSFIPVQQEGKRFPLADGDGFIRFVQIVSVHECRVAVLCCAVPCARAERVRNP